MKPVKILYWGKLWATIWFVLQTISGEILVKNKKIQRNLTRPENFDTYFLCKF